MEESKKTTENNVAVQNGAIYESDDLFYRVSDRWEEGKTQDGAYNDSIDSEKGNYVIEKIN